MRVVLAATACVSLCELTGCESCSFSRGALDVRVDIVSSAPPKNLVGHWPCRDREGIDCVKSFVPAGGSTRFELGARFDDGNWGACEVPAHRYLVVTADNCTTASLDVYSSISDDETIHQYSFSLRLVCR